MSFLGFVLSMYRCRETHHIAIVMFSSGMRTRLLWEWAKPTCSNTLKEGFGSAALWVQNDCTVWWLYGPILIECGSEKELQLFECEGQTHTDIFLMASTKFHCNSFKYLSIWRHTLNITPWNTHKQEQEPEGTYTQPNNKNDPEMWCTLSSVRKDGL